MHTNLETFASEGSIARVVEETEEEVVGKASEKVVEETEEVVSKGFPGDSREMETEELTQVGQLQRENTGDLNCCGW